jgi:tRNA pseudouridine38-40 synthase
MDHSAAILHDAGKNTDNAAAESAPQREKRPDAHSSSNSSNRHGKNSDNRRDDRKRKGTWNDNSVRHGGRGGKFQDNKRHKKGDMGRSEYLYVSIMQYASGRERGRVRETMTDV